jgi:uncharacterized protein YndB with AHSA1/START domain
MIDEKQQITDVRRTLGTRLLEGGEARVATISQAYDTDLDDLWDAVTNAERIPRWFLPVSGDLTEGGRYRLEGNAEGTITACDQPRRFAATWEYGGNVSWIEVRLSSDGDGRSRLELEHVAHDDPEFWQQFGPTATGIGWDGAFLGLASHLADPEHALAPEDAPAWGQTEAGKLVMRMSADAWIEAYIATGADPETARGMADRGYAAYTATE